MKDDKEGNVYPMNWTDTGLPYGDLDKDSLLTYLEYVVGGVFTPICCVFGMVGNALAVITWTRPALRSSTGRFLSAQAIADFGVLLLTIFIVSAKQWSPWFEHNVYFAILYSYVGFPLYYILVHTSVWLTLGVTIERYIMVCWATKAKSYCGEKQAQIGISVIVLISMLVNIPHFFIYRVNSHSSTGDASNPALTLTRFGEGHGGKVYFLYISCISLIAIPWLCVLVMNFNIVSKISYSNRRMLDKKTNESALKAKKTEAQITRLLLVVTFTFLLLMGLHCLIQILANTHPQGIDSRSLQAAYSIAKSGYVLNSSLNFLLYCMTGRRFRKELKKVLGMQLSQDEMRSSYATSSSVGNGSGTATSVSDTKIICKNDL